MAPVSQSFDAQSTKTATTTVKRRKMDKTKQNPTSKTKTAEILKDFDFEVYDAALTLVKLRFARLKERTAAATISSIPTKNPLPPSNSSSSKIIPEDFRRKITSMGGEAIQYLFTKTLTDSDIEADKNRLMLPMKQIKTEFLTKDEMEVMKTRLKNNTLMPVRIRLVEPTLEFEHSFINLKIWNVQYYVLVTEWNRVVDRNRLSKDDSLQIWCFRIGDELGFALIKA